MLNEKMAIPHIVDAVFCGEYKRCKQQFFGAREVVAAKPSTQGFKSLGAAGKGFSKTLQTGGHTLNKSTLKALGLSKQHGKIAIEGLKKDIGLPPNFHGKIMGDGDLVHPNSEQVLGNLFDYLY